MTTDTVVVAGSLAQRAGYGGHAWVFLQYLLGFRRLGYDVLFLDRLDSTMCGHAPVDDAPQLATLADTMHQYDIPHAVLTDHGRVMGAERNDLCRTLSECALLLNVMGFLDDPDLLGAAPRRAFLDIDPGFGQMWRELGLADLFHDHDVYFTVGGNVGKPGCAIPTGGTDWIATRPPIVLDEWPARPTPAGPITSVASWRGPFDAVEYDGQTFGLRVHEFRRFIDLPRLTGRRFELALDIDPADSADRRSLTEHGWAVVDPHDVATDADAFRRYVGRSRAEIGISKGMYVQTGSGWFSDRSACYLASGRPVLAQDTGLGELYPVGAGLLTFTTLEEAVAGVERVESDFDAHALAARRIAEEHFDSDVVLGTLLEHAGVG